MIAGLALDTDLERHLRRSVATQRDGVDYRAAPRAARRASPRHRRQGQRMDRRPAHARARARHRGRASASRELGLARRSASAAAREMVELTVYITALSMTFLTGKRPLRHRKVP